MKKVKYNDDLEKILTAIFGFLGIIAIFINLHIKGYGYENIFDAIKDIAGLIVAIAVFLIASKFFRRNSYSEFVKIFDENLKKWIYTNRYLIDEVKQKEGEKEEKEFYFMLTKKLHKNFVTQEVPAALIEKRKGASDYNKGAFLYTDTKEKQEIIIGINKSLFLETEYANKIEEAADLIKNRIIDFSKNIEFEKISGKVKFSNEDVRIGEQGKRLFISIKDIEKSDENAKMLVDMLEYIKTLILAIA
jgi:hypothetical protein